MNSYNYVKYNFDTYPTLILLQINLPSDTQGISWWLSAIYGPARRRTINRVEFWNELKNLQSVCLPNWLLEGDFNVIRWNSETSAKHLTEYSMKKFNAFIESNNLIEPPLTNANTLGLI